MCTEPSCGEMTMEKQSSFMLAKICEKVLVYVGGELARMTIK